MYLLVTKLYYNSLQNVVRHSIMLQNKTEIKSHCYRNNLRVNRFESTSISRFSHTYSRMKE